MALELRPSTISAPPSTVGRGVFTTEPIAAGETFESSLALRLPADQLERFEGTVIYDHYFGDSDDGLIPLSICTYLNHSDDPNASFRIDGDTIHFAAATDIAADTEVTIRYSQVWW